MVGIEVFALYCATVFDFSMTLRIYNI